MTSVREFWRASVAYVSPQSDREWREFYWQLPRAFVIFYGLEMKWIWIKIRTRLRSGGSAAP